MLTGRLSRDASRPSRSSLRFKSRAIHPTHETIAFGDASEVLLIAKTHAILLVYCPRLIPVFLATALSVAHASIEYKTGERLLRLEELEAAQANAPTDPGRAPEIAERSKQAIRLVESNSLATADEFLRVSKCVYVTDNAFRATRVRYELILSAAALGSHEAQQYLAGEWDRLQRALGRPVRFGVRRDAPNAVLEAAAPACVRAILRDPAKARALARELKPSDELARLADADTTGASAESPSTEQARQAGKLAQLTRLIEAGEVRTSADFLAAALVTHRSGSYSGNLLAHELAVCAVLLGGGSQARWLVAATYDRMLRATGHDQRFGTQYVSWGGTNHRAQVDPAGISDNQRRALGCEPIVR